MLMPGSAYFHLSRSTAVYHQNYVELDAVTNKIGISMKNWVRECLDSVGMWRMGPIMSWFALGFVMSDAIF